MRTDGHYSAKHPNNRPEIINDTKQHGQKEISDHFYVMLSLFAYPILRQKISRKTADF
jgi:hypothetical protein